MPDARPDRGERDDQGRQSDDQEPLSLGGAPGRFRLCGNAGFERIDVHRLSDILQTGRAEIRHAEVEPALDLPISLLGKANRAGFGDPFQPRGDIDAVAHEVAVALLDDVANVNADAVFYPLLGRQAHVALGHAELDFDCAAHGVDHAAELDEDPVAGALDDAAAVHGDRRIDEVAPKRPQSGERAFLVSLGEPAVTHHVGGQHRRQLSALRHSTTPGGRNLSQLSKSWLSLPSDEGASPRPATDLGAERPPFAPSTRTEAEQECSL